MSSLCVITPTISRPTLERAIRSTRLGESDEWIVFGDGFQPEARAVIERLKAEIPNLVYLETDRPTHDNGNTQRNLAMSVSRKSYFLFLDDDDVFLPGAIEAVRKEMDNLPVMFRMEHPAGVIWREMVITPGNVGGSMICVPNDPDKYGQWPEGVDNHDTDIDFITETVSGFDGLIWSGKIIIEVSPERIREHELQEVEGYYREKLAGLHQEHTELIEAAHRRYLESVSSLSVKDNYDV